MPSGHVRKRGRRWAHVRYVVDPATGRAKQKWTGGFGTRAEAQRALREVLVAVDRGSFVEPSNLTLREFVESIWLKQLSTQVASSTYDSYERNLRVHVLPAIGAMPLQQLAPLHLNELYQELAHRSVVLPAGATRRHDPRIAELRAQECSYREIADQLAVEFPNEPALSRHAVARIVARSREQRVGERGLSVRTVRYIHSIIRRALADAVKLRLVGTNAAAGASPPRQQPHAPRKALWTPTQTQQFLGWCRDMNIRLWPAWAFSATSGARRGAVLGLRWRDVDLEAGTADLIYNITCVRHEIVVKPYGKTRSAHRIQLDDRTVAVLRAWNEEQQRERPTRELTHHCRAVEVPCDAAGRHDRGLVFPAPDGDYLHPERFSRTFDRAQQAFNAQHPNRALPRITLHSLRHGWATTALELGVATRVVQDRLNHASAQITSDLYMHVRTPLQTDAAQRVAAQLLPSVATRPCAADGELGGHRET